MALDREVLADLCARLRRADIGDPNGGTVGPTVYEITREELSAAYYGRILELDRRATAALLDRLSADNAGPSADVLGPSADVHGR